MRLFFYALALLTALFGAIMACGGVYVALFWVQEAEFAFDALAVLALALLLACFGTIFILAPVRFFRTPDQRTAKDMAGVSCFLVWAFLPSSFEQALAGYESRGTELLPLMVSLLVALLLYRLVFVPMIERIYSAPPAPDSS